MRPADTFFTELEAVISFAQHCSPLMSNSLNKTRAIYSLYNLA